MFDIISKQPVGDGVQYVLSFRCDTTNDLLFDVDTSEGNAIEFISCTLDAYPRDARVFVGGKDSSVVQELATVVGSTTTLKNKNAFATALLIRPLSQVPISGTITFKAIALKQAPFFTGPSEPDPTNTTATGAGTPRLFLKTYQDWVQSGGHVSEALNMVSLTRTAKSVQSWKLDPSLYAGMAVNPFDAGVPDPVGDSLVAQVFHELLVDAENAIEFFVPFSDFTTFNGQTYGTASSSGRANNTVYRLAHGLSNGTRVWLATRFNDGANDFIQGLETQHNKSYYAKVLDANTFELYRDVGLTDLIIIGQNTSAKNASFGILVTTNQNHGHFSFAEVADHTRQLHTKFAVDYWSRWVMLKITESLLVLSGAGVEQWIVADESVNQGINFGRRVNAPMFRLRRNSSNNFDLDYCDDNYQASTALRLFRSTGNLQVGGGTTDRGGKLTVRGTTASQDLLCLVDDSTSRSKSFLTEIVKVTTTDTTQTTLWSYTLPDPSVSPNKINIVSFEATLIATNITDEGAGTPEIEVGTFKVYGQARRRSGSTVQKGADAIELKTNSTTLTAGSVEIDTASGALRIRVTGEASKTYEWVAKVEFHTYMTP